MDVFWPNVDCKEGITLENVYNRLGRKEFKPLPVGVDDDGNETHASIDIEFTNMLHMMLQQQCGMKMAALLQKAK